MAEADVVVTLGRRLGFQLAYGSPAVFGSAKLIRIADAPSELRDNRRGAVELFAQPAAALAAILAAAGDRPSAVDRGWAAAMRNKHLERVEQLRQSMQSAAPDAQGRMHPNRLLMTLQPHMARDAVLVADGGDFLSFARVGLSASSYLDPGSLGCIGGTAFGVAASSTYPGRQVIVATGDGAFGFNAMEIDTAVRHEAKLLIVVANNGAGRSRSTTRPSASARWSRRSPAVCRSRRDGQGFRYARATGGAHRRPRRGHRYSAAAPAGAVGCCGQHGRTVFRQSVRPGLGSGSSGHRNPGTWLERGWRAQA